MGQERCAENAGVDRLERPKETQEGKSGVSMGKQPFKFRVGSSGFSLGGDSPYRP